MSKSQFSSSLSRPEDCICDYEYKKKNKPRFEGQTTNKLHYKPYRIQKQPEFQAPKPQKKSYDPNVLVSNYKSNFTKPPTQNNNNYGQTGDSMMNYKYEPKKIPLATQTQYKKSFQPSQIKVQKQPQYVYQPKNTKFQGKSTYKNQFTNKAIQGNQPASSSEIAYHALYKNKPKVPFTGKSSYQQTFVQHDSKPQKQPQYNYKPKNTKFQGQSSYKMTFKNYGSQAYKSDLEHCPVHPERIATKIK